MRVISVQQPWAQLIADRRRHVIIKACTDWKPEPGEMYALHASHVRDDYNCKVFGYSLEDCHKNAILGLLEVKKVIDRGLTRKSKFDAPESLQRKNMYAIVVRVAEKYRKPVEITAPRPLRSVWECEL